MNEWRHQHVRWKEIQKPHFHNHRREMVNEGKDLGDSLVTLYNVHENIQLWNNIIRYHKQTFLLYFLSYHIFFCFPSDSFSFFLVSFHVSLFLLNLAESICFSFSYWKFPKLELRVFHPTAKLSTAAPYPQYSIQHTWNSTYRPITTCIHCSGCRVY